MSGVRWGGRCDPLPDGGHVIVIDTDRIDRGLLRLMGRERVFHRVIKHELCHALNVPCRRSHTWSDHHCTHPWCILYPRADMRSILTMILRFGPPMDLCDACRQEIRRAQEAARGRLIGPDEPYDSLAAMNEVVRLNAANSRAYGFRAEIHKQRKDCPKAIADLTKAIELDPGNPLEYMYRAQAYYAQKAYDKAISDYTKALELDPGDRTVMCYRNRGAMFVLLRRYDRAVSDYERCLQLKGDDVMGLGNMAYLLATCEIDAIRNGPRAVELARRACELTRWKNPWALDILAAACAEAGRFEQAVEYATKAISLAGKTQAELYRRRLTLYQNGKPFRYVPD